MATIYDVARLAGVSSKTVSRVMNGDGPVRAPTREAVEAAMRELAFVPSSAARMMRSAKSGLVGLITGAISRTTALAEPTGLPDLFIVQGIQKCMAENGMTLMIADTGGSQDNVAPLIRTFQEHRVEGMIYVADHHQQIILPDIPVETPFVLANCFDAQGTPHVVPDDEGGKFALVSKIILAGHTRIAYLTLPELSVATRLRSNGYRRALESAGIAFDPDLVLAAYGPGYSTDVGLLTKVIDRLLLNPDPPTVLCLGNDEMALRAYGILRTRGISVPNDMSVAGFDDYRAISTMLVPPLSTVDLPYHQMGQEAAKKLIGLITNDGPKTDDRATVASAVVWRESVVAKTAQTTQRRKT
jgi:LacI family transcriptional regulator